MSVQLNHLMIRIAITVGAFEAIVVATLAALVATGPAGADDVSEAVRQLCRDSADMASSVSHDLTTAPPTMTEYQSYRGRPAENTDPRD
jgi:hypothetical protein